MPRDIVINTYGSNYVPNFAIVIPIHSKNTISDFVSQIFHKLVETSESYIEIVLSGANGVDETQELITNLSTKIPIKAIISNGHKGYGDEIRDGLRMVSAPYVIIADSDSPIRREDFDILKKRLGNLVNPKDVIISLIREKNPGHLYNRLFSKIFYRMNSMAFDLPILNDICSPFKLMSTDLAKTLVSECKFMTDSFWTEFIVRACDKNIKVVEVRTQYIKKSGNEISTYGMVNVKSISLSVVTRQLIGMVKLKRELSGNSFITSIVRTKAIRRLITFALIGTIGALLTLFLTWLGVNFHLYYIYSAAIGIQVSIISAFLLHDRITFKDKVRSYRLSNILFRYLKYNISSLGGQTINLCTLFILTTLGLFYLYSEMVAIMVAFIFNYTISRKWVWGKG